jgi:hypothetical protein
MSFGCGLVMVEKGELENASFVCRVENVIGCLNMYMQLFHFKDYKFVEQTYGVRSKMSLEKIPCGWTVGVLLQLKIYSLLR